MQGGHTPGAGSCYDLGLLWDSWVEGLGMFWRVLRFSGFGLIIKYFPNVDSQHDQLSGVLCCGSADLTS